MNVNMAMDMLLYWQLFVISTIAVHLISLIHLTITWNKKGSDRLLHLGLLLFVPLFGPVIYWTSLIFSCFTKKERG